MKKLVKRERLNFRYRFEEEIIGFLVYWLYEMKGKEELRLIIMFRRRGEG